MSQPFPNSCIVLFGATGDLTRRKLIPALFSLYEKNQLANISILAIGRKPMSSEEFRTYLKQEKSSQSASQNHYDAFLEKMEYLELPIDNSEGYAPLRDRLTQYSNTYIIFYLSVPPELFVPIISGIGNSGLNSASSTIAIEKPFGFNLESAQKLNTLVTQYFREDQIFRIDHYVGKETIQNILTFRFANSLFEPIWNNHYIDNIQITASESLGVENRGPYYDRSGALRDMIQNHLFQVLSLAAMEPPYSLASSAIQDEKVKVLRSLRLGKDNLSHVVFGQYSGYKNESWVAENSRTETFVALRLEIHNWRLKGVPIYIRTGKALASKATRIVVEFKKNTSILYSEPAELERNRIIFEIAPNEGITVGFNVKEYGTSSKTRSVTSEFLQSKEWSEAYEHIMSELLLRSHTLFTRWDMIQESWKIVDDLIDCKENCPILHNYEIGSEGPKAANELLAIDGRKWFS